MTKTLKLISISLAVLGIAATVSLQGQAQQSGQLVRSARFGGDGDATKGGTLTYGLVGLPPTFNPFTVQSLSDTFIQYLWFPQLVQFNAASGQNECYVCTSFSQKGSDINFNIRTGIKWSDGKALTADDIIYSAELHANAKINSRQRTDFVQAGKPIKWTKVDADTIKMTLNVADAAYLDLADWPIVPKHVWQPIAEKGEAAVQAAYTVSTDPKEIVGAGPFLVESYKPGEEMTLRKNPDYWGVDEKGNKLPYLDRIIAKNYADTNARLAGFIAGQQDIFQPLTIDEVQGVRQAVTAGRLEAELKINITQTAVTSTIFCNFQNKDAFKATLCRNIKFRRALSHLVDRETIIKVGLGGLGKALYGPISSGNTKWYNDALYVEGKTKFSYDPEKATALLRGLGFTRKNAEGFLVNGKGQTIKMNALVVSTEALQKVAAPIIIEDMKKAGIDASFTVADNGSVINPALRTFNPDGTRNFDLSFTDFGGVFDPPTRRNLYNLGGVAHIWNLNRTGQVKPDKPETFEILLDKLVSQGLSTLDLEGRKKIYNQFQQVAAENLPLVYLYTRGLHIAYKKRVGNTQDQLKDPMGAFQSTANGYVGELFNFLDTAYVKGN
jgi:peptide/nickel transport system substrate-binding protein